MNIQIKRLAKPAICVLLGVLMLVLMAFGYAAPFYTADGESESASYSAYETIHSKEEALEDVLEFWLQLCGKDIQATFFLSLSSFLLVMVIVVSSLSILLGLIGLVKELLHINVLGRTKPRIYNFAYLGAVGAVAVLNVFSALAVLLACLFNLYTGEFYGTTIAMGLKPEAGLFLMCILSIAAAVGMFLLIKKPASTTVYTCTACQGTIKSGLYVCPTCGAHVTAETLATAAQTTSADEEIDDSVPLDLTSLSVAVKSAGASISAFLAKHNISAKLAALVAGGALAAILLIVVLINIPWPQKPAYVMPENHVFTVYSAEDEETLILTDGKEFKRTLDGRLLSQTLSMGGDVLALSIPSDEYASSGAYTLYLLYDNSLVEIEEYVLSYAMSNDGSAVVYVNTDGELMLYNATDATRKKITDEPYEHRYSLSPNGDSVLYAKERNTGSTLYLWKDGKSTEINDNLIPMALSNDGEVIYYINPDKDSIYVSTEKGGEIKLVNGVSDKYNSLYLVYNADHTQILISLGDDAYLSKNGEEKVKLTSDGLRQFGATLTRGISVSQTVSDSWSNYAVVISAATSPLRDFRNQYFLDDNGELKYVNKKLKITDVAEDISSYQTSDSGKTIYYRTTERVLMRGEKPKGKFKEVATEVSSYTVTANGRACYLLDSSSTLSYVKMTGKIKHIADDVHDLQITHDSYALFISDYHSTNGGTLYHSRNGKKKTRIADDILAIRTAAAGAYYIRSTGRDGDNELAWTQKKVDFKVIAENIEYDD